MILVSPVHPKSNPVAKMNDNQYIKFWKSKPVQKILKGYEKRLQKIDPFYKNKETDELIKKDAINFLKIRVEKDLGSDYTCMVDYIERFVDNERSKAEKFLKKIGIIDIGEFGREVLRLAIARENQFNIAEKIVNEAQANGQEKLDYKQEKKIRMALKKADEYDNERIRCAKERQNAIINNKAVLAENGSEALLAYKYLHDIPEIL